MSDTARHGSDDDSTLSPEQYRILQELVETACLLPAGQRRGFLEDVCANIPGALPEALALLRGHEATAEADASAYVGLAIGPYRVERELGRGGMGSVFLARRADESYDKHVAIKLIAAEHASEDLRARFTLERRILASLEHPNIARLIDGGALDGKPYIVMEYVDGIPVTTYADRARLSVRERIALFQVVCGAVTYAHQHLIVHRDLKPTNILVAADGTPKLLDFGIAKLLTPGGQPASFLTAPHYNPATPRYASPEQLEGQQVETSADVYSLGVVLYELLSGRLPLQHESSSTIASVSAAIVAAPSATETTQGTAPPTSTAIAAARRGSTKQLIRTLRGDLDAIVARALAPQPSERYQSPADLADDLQRYLDHVPVIARPRTPPYVARAYIARHAVGIAASASIAVSLIGGLVGTYWQWQRAEAERARAERRFDGLQGLAMSVFDVSALLGTNAAAARDSLIANSLRYLENLEQNAAGDPRLLRQVATGYRQLGDAQRGQPSGSASALDTYRRALRVSQQVAQTEPNDRTAQREVAGNYERVGSALIETGTEQEGRDVLQQSLTLYQQLLQADRNSATAQRDLLLSHLRYADAMVATDPAAATASYEEGRKIAQALVDRDPQNTQAMRDLVVTTDRLRALGVAVGSTDAREEEAKYYEGVKDSDDLTRLEYFLERFPNGEHAPAIRARVAAVKSGKGRSNRGPARARTAPADAPPQPAAAPPPPANVVQVDAEWKTIPAGRFEMGCDLRPDKTCRDDERPRHWVTISRPFAMMATEVTVGQYRAYARSSGKPVPDQPAWNLDDRLPVVNVTWDQSVQFCTALGGRLPSEAEWEWAAAGGRADSPYPWGEAYDRTKGNSGFPGRDGWDRTAPVATFPPNGYGLYEMSGNVWEWTGDWYAPKGYEQAVPVDPRGPATGSSHVLRGGSYATSPEYLRITQRGTDTIDRRREATGFRCVR
jgi:non-specific serine/threonine protein kinase/serine/threonine-protein kinase